MKKTIRIGERKQAYRIIGSGQPVMLVHGFGEDSRIWDTIVPLLSGDHRILLPDLPGSGESERQEDMSLENMANVLDQILKTEGIKNVVLIGHSMGGYIALAFAERYGSCLDGLGLFHSTAYADTEERIALRRKGIDFIREHGAATFLRTTLPNLFTEMNRTGNKEGPLSVLMDRADAFDAETLIAYYEAMIERPDRSVLLKTLKKPILIIQGEFDTVVSMASGQQLSLLPEKSYFHILTRSGHMGMLEEPEGSARILRSFLGKTVKNRLPEE